MKRNHYEVPPFPEECYPFTHLLLASSSIPAFLFHMLQNQIAQNYADPKLIEMLLYLVQAIARFDLAYGKTSHCTEISKRGESA